MDFKTIMPWMDKELQLVLDAVANTNEVEADDGNMMLLADVEFKGKVVSFGFSDSMWVGTSPDNDTDAIFSVEADSVADFRQMVQASKTNPYIRSVFIHEFTHLFEILNGIKFTEQPDDGNLMNYISNSHEFLAVANELAFIAHHNDIEKDREPMDFLQKVIKKSVYDGYDYSGNPEKALKLVEEIKQQL